MIRIQSLVIEEFRGIRKLKLTLGTTNFAICGPNGTGKSGVVDAIEFAITGGISRLTGQGTSPITLKAHAPHVDRRDQPDKARIVLKAHFPSLDKHVTIERRVSAPAAPTITPSDPDVISAFAELAQHPEFALSRREIIKYVVAAPGERSKEVQALLRLDQIEKVRQSLQYILNACKTEGKRIEQEVSQAQSQLLRALGTSSLKKEDILRAVNSQRQVLTLAPLAELGANTSLKSGLGATSAVTTRPKLAKKQALVDIAALSERIASGESKDVTDSREKVIKILDKLLKSPSLLRSLRLEDFLRSGLDFIQEDACPFCDTQWDVPALRSHVQQKLDEAKQAAELKSSLETTAQPLAIALRGVEGLASTVCMYGEQLLPKVETSSLGEWVSCLQGRRERIVKLADIKDVVADLSQGYLQTPDVIPKLLANIRKGVEALPDPSTEEGAKEYLTICQERLDVYREARRTQERCKKQAELAMKVLACYSESSTSVLTQIYKGVEQDFSKYYRIINREDEATFQGKLTPSLGKLGFDVEFYGRGYFPPGAYHSEGHQDAMGICLYLALMKHTLGTQFTFAALDDVLMSVDAGHRREVCGLLKAEFPATQFIITTHDPIWLQHMKTEQVITAKSSVQFRKWTVDDGPVVWDAKEVWKEISDELDASGAPGAAGTLRRYLEYISAHLSDKLRASVEFHGDAQYDLGDLLPGVIHAWKKLLARAQEAAHSWGHKEDVTLLSERQAEFARRVAISQVEQWAINRSVHYTEWASLTKQDFLPVVESFKNVLDSFRCELCDGLLYVMPPKGPQEGIRCDCGVTNINLKKKR